MTYFLFFRLHPLGRRLAFWAALATLVTTLLAGCGRDDARPTAPGRIPVASVRLDPIDEALVVGTERLLRATPLSATGAALDDRTVRFESDNDGVATVSAAGVLTARGEGRASIVAISEGKSSRIEVRIVSPNPVPVLAVVSPATITAGSAGPVAVNVHGTGFTDATALRVDGAAQATQRVDATTLRMQLTTSAMETASVLRVTAFTPAPGGGESNTVTLTIADVPAPAITTLDPRQITAGWGGAFTLTIIGNDFSPRSTVEWDGAPRAAHYVSATSLRVTIDPQDVRVARIVPVTVATPAPGGGRATMNFAVNAIPVASVTVESPWGQAWTWRNHGLPLAAVAQDQLGRELSDRRAAWHVLQPSVATVVPLSEREARVYGTTAGETDVEAVVDGVSGYRTVRVHDVPGHELVYEAGEGDDRHLMLWDLITGNAPRRWLTPMVAFSPSPSPDGREVAFAGMDKAAGIDGNVDLFIVARDGSTRPVAPSPAFDGDPAWSPDGRSLAFTSARATGALDVFRVDLASGTVTRLTNAAVTGGSTGSGYAARWPAWSPDGSRIAYTVQGTTGAELWVMSADGSQKRQLTNAEEAHALEPTWAPDGSVIAFSRVFRQSPQSLLMTVNPDGSNLTTIGGRLVSVAATPAYSPDGRWLTTSQTRGSGTGAVYAFSIAANAGPRIVMPEQLGGGRHARWMRKP